MKKKKREINVYFLQFFWRKPQELYVVVCGGFDFGNSEQV